MYLHFHIHINLAKYIYLYISCQELIEKIDMSHICQPEVESCCDEVTAPGQDRFKKI